MSYQDAIREFIHAMECEGIIPESAGDLAQRLANAPGERIRFRSDGDGKGRLNGFARIFLDERPAGVFGNYRLGIRRTWKSGDDRVLTAEERRQLSEEWSRKKLERQRERDIDAAEAAKDAIEMWQRAEPASPQHGYVAKKGLDPGRFRQLGDKLLVPMFDSDGELCNLQRISPDGSKRFLKGGRTDGLFFIIGAFTRRGETACIGEGLATMHAVHRASGYPCVVAFSAANLAAVARLWNARRPDLHFILCADDDAHLERNTGIEAAKAAAEEIGARVAIPLGRAA